MEQNIGDRKPLYRKIDTEDETAYNERNKLILPLSASVIVLILIILYFTLTSQSNYENGVQYLSQNQYTEALVEFQKVDSDEKDFILAQSKINYINGLLAYKESVFPQAKLYLVKVEPSDEYYREARLMIGKIGIADKQGNLELLSEKLNHGSDTVIIKEKVMETPADNVGEAESRNSDLMTLKNYKIIVESLSGKFEALYQSARNASVVSKKVFVKDMDSLFSEFKKINTPTRNSQTAELKQITDSWMQKRLFYINRLIAENSVNETNSSLTLKEEGDKDYRLLQTIIKNNQLQ